MRTRPYTPIDTIFCDLFQFVFWHIFVILKTLDLKIHVLKIGFQEIFEIIHFTGEIIIFIKWKIFQGETAFPPGVY